MPWCATCDRFLSPPSVTAEGACPTCGRPVEAGRAHPPAGATDTEAPPSGGEEEFPPVPLHMKILGASVVIYLGYRFLQGVGWIIHRF